MYVVKRAFRNYNVMIAPGSVVEPGTIKHLKSRIRDGSLIEVTEHDFDKWNEYFFKKYGVPISIPAAAEPSTPVEEPTAIVTKPKPAVKATAKAVAK